MGAPLPWDFSKACRDSRPLQTACFRNLPAVLKVRISTVGAQTHVRLRGVLLVSAALAAEISPVFLR